MRLPRASIERLVDGIIAGLDVLDGDPDEEPEIELVDDDREGPGNV